jgi:hypothetical protein
VVKTDDGWKSRKLGLALITMGLVFSGWLICGHPVGLYDAMCTALIVSAGIYKVSNAGDTWLKSKTGGTP